MASSRTQRIGTVFTRVKALLRSGALNIENRPLWYDVYEAFPPKYAPSFSRKPPETGIRNIFYPEDCIRAKFHKDIHSPPIHLDGNKVNHTQLFLTIYESLLQSKGDIKEEEAYDVALESYKAIFKPQNRSSTTKTSSASSDKETKEK